MSLRRQHWQYGFRIITACQKTPERWNSYLQLIGKSTAMIGHHSLICYG
jgi:hypothetical protein